MPIYVCSLAQIFKRLEPRILCLVRMIPPGYHGVYLTFARPGGVEHRVSHATTLAQPGEDNVFISGIVMGSLN